jgi:hypothetical protein
LALTCYTASSKADILGVPILNGQFTVNVMTGADAYQLQQIKNNPAATSHYISDDGNVYSTKISPRYNPEGELRLVKPRLHPSGYLYYGLFVGEGKDKQRLWRRGHRLVYEKFGGEIPKGLEIDHIDGNKHNNDITNLRAVTRSQNMKAMWERKNKTK